MSDMEPPTRISVSEDKLRSMFAEFKLDLFTELQKYATLVALSAVEHRLDDLRLHNEQRIAKLELWRAAEEAGENQGRRFSAGVVAWAAVAIAALSVTVYVYVNHGTN